MQFKFSTVTPAQVEKISGLSTATQRDWRSRGLIAQNEGHARMNILEVAKIWVMKILSDRGIGPSRCEEIADLAARSIAYFALGHPEAFAGEVSVNSIRIGGVAIRTVDDRLQRGAYRALCNTRAVPAPLLIWWPNSEPIWHDSFDEAFSDLPRDDRRRVGPIIVLSLSDMARELLHRFDDVGSNGVVHAE